MTFLLDQYFYLHTKLGSCFSASATEQAQKVLFQARMCVRDSFVKCWQQPHEPLPSLSSPPTHPGGWTPETPPLWLGVGVVLFGARGMLAVLCGKGHGGHGW